MMRSLAAVLALVVVSLAGCSDDAPATAEEDPTFDDFEDDVSDGKGLIRGVVLDDTIQPIVEAKVTIKGTEESTLSNENGAFQFTDVEPGSYILTVTKAGYEPIQTSVSVEAGDGTPDIVKIQMPRAPGTEPFFTGYSHQGFISCGFKTANFVWSAGSCDPTGVLGMQARDDSQFAVDLTTDQNPEYYQSEVQWEANQPLSSGLVTIQCARDNSGCGSGVGSDRLCNIRGPSPLICRIAEETPSGDVPGGGNNFTTIRDGAGIGDQVAIGMYSNCAVVCDPVFGSMGVGVAVDQEYQVYIHLFYNYRPPEDWAFIDSGTVPEPPE